MDRPYPESKGWRAVAISVVGADGGKARLRIDGPQPSHIRKVLREKGLFAYEGRNAAALLALAERTPQGVFLDVGANIGIYSGVVATAMPQMDVYAFEPAADCIANLRYLVEVNRLPIHPVEAAVSESTGTATLLLSSQTDTSHSLVEGHRVARGSVQVQTVTLDDWVAQTGAVPDLIKVDVERHEAAMLRGARGVLEQHRPVLVMEFLPGTGAADEAGTSGRFCAAARDARRLARQMGYTFERIRTPAELAGRMTSRDSHDYILWPGEPDPQHHARYVAWLERLRALRSARRSTARQKAGDGGAADVRSHDAAAERQGEAAGSSADAAAASGDD